MKESKGTAKCEVINKEQFILWGLQEEKKEANLVNEEIEIIKKQMIDTEH